MQLAIVAHKPIIQSIKEMLWSYVTTPNGVTGYSPFSLLRGRKPVSKLTPSWLFEDKSFVCDERKTQERILRHQERYKHEYDHRWGTKPREWSVGQQVLVKNPNVSANRYHRFHGPVTISDVKRNVVTMSDGKMWSMDRLVPFPLPATSSRLNNEVKMSADMPSSKRSGRVSRSPSWHDDFVMN